MLKLIINFFATGMLSLNSNGAILLINGIYNVSPDPDSVKKTQKKDISSQIKEYISVHLLDLEYLTTISITLLAILIGTGKSLKYQSSLPKNKNITSFSTEGESMKSLDMGDFNGNLLASKKSSSTATIEDISVVPSVSLEVVQKQLSEQQEYYYRKKYKKLQQQVRQLPQFVDISLAEEDDWEIDVEVALIILSESPKDKEELSRVLHQSDRAINWEISLSESEYQAQVRDYIEKIGNWAEDVRKLRISYSTSN